MSNASVTVPKASTRSLGAVRLNRALAVHRVVQAGILLTLIWKWSFFTAASRLYGMIPLEDPFFPALFQSVWTLRFAYLSTTIAVAVNLVAVNRTLQRVCAAVALLNATVLCIHQGSYNDMTFVTAWWTCLWAMWYVHHLDDQDQATMLRRASFLSRLIISMILLGGASGKWTSEYWSGEVFYDIYFIDREYWVFNLLRSYFNPDQLQSIAMWYSRKVVVIETIAGLGLWALPPRLAAGIGVIVLSSIALLSNFLLFSVLFAVIGLASVGFFVSPLATHQQDANV
jgi:hypothetical protein